MKDIAVMFDSQLTTGWVHHFILRNSNVSWKKGTERRWKADRQIEGSAADL